MQTKQWDYGYKITLQYLFCLLSRIKQLVIMETTIRLQQQYLLFLYCFSLLKPCLHTAPIWPQTSSMGINIVLWDGSERAGGIYNLFIDFLQHYCKLHLLFFFKSIFLLRLNRRYVDSQYFYIIIFNKLMCSQRLGN